VAGASGLSSGILLGDAQGILPGALRHELPLYEKVANIVIAKHPNGRGWPEEELAVINFD